jgi:hypothetical protein
MTMARDHLVDDHDCGCDCDCHWPFCVFDKVVFQWKLHLLFLLFLLLLHS